MDKPFYCRNPEGGIFFLADPDQRVKAWLSWALNGVEGEEELSIQCVRLHLRPMCARCPQALNAWFYPLQRLNHQGGRGAGDGPHCAGTGWGSRTIRFHVLPQLHTCFLRCWCCWFLRWVWVCACVCVRAWVCVQFELFYSFLTIKLWIQLSELDKSLTTLLSAFQLPKLSILLSSLQFLWVDTFKKIYFTILTVI